MGIGVSEFENPQTDLEELDRAENCGSLVVLEDATLNCEDPKT